LKCVLILSTTVLGMSTYNGLADLLFGRTRGAILALLFGHVEQSFEIAGSKTRARTLAWWFTYVRRDQKSVPFHLVILFLPSAE
jgi:hypothetical protein